MVLCIILSLLALIIIVIAAAVFSPLSYAVYYTTLSRGAVFKWIFGIVKIYFKSGGIYLSVFGIMILPRKKPAKKDKPAKEENKTDTTENNTSKKTEEKSSKKSVRKEKNDGNKKEEKKSSKGKTLFKQATANKDIINYAMILLREAISALSLKKFMVWGVIGFDDPALTGQIIGLIWFLNGILPVKAHIRGNFTEAEMKINVFLKGRTSFLAFAVPLIKFIFRKPVWAIIRNKS
jgi:hypothetical protein